MGSDGSHDLIFGFGSHYNLLVLRPRLCLHSYGTNSVTVLLDTIRLIFLPVKHGLSKIVSD
jgi:hypothetical protein